MAGKPEPTLFAESVRRLGARAALVVGDRVDTDIEGAVKAGLDSLLVMTGVTGPSELVAIPAGLRPTYLAADLGALIRPHPGPDDDEGWTAGVRDGRLTMAGSGSVDAWWRVLAGEAWRHLDATGVPVGIAADVAAGSVI